MKQSFVFQVALVGGREAGPQSVFELRLKRFHHSAEAKDCAAVVETPTTAGENSAVLRRCETKFRVCLKHFMAHVDGSNMCTFGEEVLTTVGRQNDSIHLPPVRFDIGFKWPVRISVFFSVLFTQCFFHMCILEHDVSDLDIPGSEIIRCCGS